MYCVWDISRKKIHTASFNPQTFGVNMNRFIILTASWASYYYTTILIIALTMKNHTKSVSDDIEDPVWKICGTKTSCQFGK